MSTRIDKRLAKEKNLIRFLNDLFSGTKHDVKKRNRAILFVVYIIMATSSLVYIAAATVFSPYSKRPLYFYDLRDGELVKERQKIIKHKTLPDKARALIEALRNGPMSLNYERLIPYGTQIHDVFIADDMLILNCSEDFFLDVKSGREAFVLESIKKTVFKNFRRIDKIQILINNQRIRHYGEDVWLHMPLLRPSLEKKLRKGVAEQNAILAAQRMAEASNALRLQRSLSNTNMRTNTTTGAEEYVEGE